jgi:hypothetical protein
MRANEKPFSWLKNSAHNSSSMNGVAGEAPVSEGLKSSEAYGFSPRQNDSASSLPLNLL